MYLVSKNPKRQLTILKQDVENLEKHERFRFIGDSSFLSIKIANSCIFMKMTGPKTLFEDNNNYILYAF